MQKNFKVGLLWIVLILMVGGFLLWVVSKPLSTEQNMLRRCGLTQNKSRSYFNSNDHPFQSGWDASHRFYVVKGTKEVGIVDSQKGQCCVLSAMGNWAEGAFTNDTYDIRYHNQYGWYSTTSLDLQLWEVSTSVSGECPIGIGCRHIDPPRITNLGQCQSNQVYEPAGLN